MCGIFGVISNNEYLKSNEIVAQCLDIQKHRGPDASGTWNDAHATFAHNRLSIIDLSEKGKQPMTNAKQSIVIVFNGEIYNFPTLKSELLTKGFEFISTSDTEVIINGYEAWGEEIFSKIHGMFSFCLYDIVNKKFYLVRDRFGKKPLYYSQLDDNSIIFASELNTILAHPAIDKSINEDAIDLFLSLQYIPQPSTVYRKIVSVDAGSFLKIDGRNKESKKYYSLKVSPQYQGIEYPEALQLIRQQVEESVTKRMISDVPLGSFLSGGIDSSIITAVLAQNSTKPVTTISVGFQEKKYSELDKAASMAKRYKTEHHEYVLNLDDAHLHLAKIVNAYGQPFGDQSAIPTYFLSQVTRKHVTVALSGDGGDELFSGYQRYHLDKKINNLQKFIPTPILKLLVSVFGIIPPKKNVPIERNWTLGLKRLKQVLEIDKKASILRWGSFFSIKHKRELYQTYGYNEDLAVQMMKRYFEYSENKDITTASQYCDLHTYAPGDYLVKTDIAAMQNSIEVRCPLLDHELAEIAFSLPRSFHFKGMNGKRILKEAFSKDLTNEVLYGPKQGFSMPLAEWFRGSWLTMLYDYINSTNSFSKIYFQRKYIDKMIEQHKTNKDDHSKRLYLLLVLEIWYQNLRK